MLFRSETCPPVLQYDNTFIKLSFSIGFKNVVTSAVEFATPETFILLSVHSEGSIYVVKVADVALIAFTGGLHKKSIGGRIEPVGTVVTGKKTALLVVAAAPGVTVAVTPPYKIPAVEATEKTAAPTGNLQTTDLCKSCIVEKVKQPTKEFPETLSLQFTKTDML